MSSAIKYYMIFIPVVCATRNIGDLIRSELARHWPASSRCHINYTTMLAAAIQNSTADIFAKEKDIVKNRRKYLRN